MKIVIAIVFAGILTGCAHNVPCPPGLGDPGELCTRVMLPSPIDPIITVTQAIITGIAVVEGK